MNQENNIDFSRIGGYFAGKLKTFGATPRGADWNGSESQENRFFQLAKIIDPSTPYSLLDYGSGYGALYDYLRAQQHTLNYLGYDIVAEMADQGNHLHTGIAGVRFTSRDSDLVPNDYAIASGIFNIRLDHTYQDWTDYVVKTITRMNDLSVKGFSFNLLTKYSDPGYMRSDLYYADPGFFFDYCKIHFSRNVALLHDYGLYDFTILVRKVL